MISGCGLPVQPPLPPIPSTRTGMSRLLFRVVKPTYENIARARNLSQRRLHALIDGATTTTMADAKKKREGTH